MALKKVLLAEDDADDQELFQQFLEHRRDILLMPHVENGVELLKSLENITNNNDLPDLIILDQNMPKKNGLQTLQSLKETNRYKHIPVMLYSTYTDQKLINACSEIGATAVMSKPSTKEEYDKMIDSFLKFIC